MTSMHENLDVESPMIDLTDCQPKIKEKTLTEAEKTKITKSSNGEDRGRCDAQYRENPKDKFSSKERSQIAERSEAKGA